MIRMIYNMVQADKKNEQADRINIRAFEKMAASEEKLEQQEYATKMAIEKLANRKRGILVTSIKDFLQIYERIIKINFKESDGIKELYQSNLEPAVYEEMQHMTAVAGMQLTDSQTVATFILGGVSGVIRKEAELNVNVASIRNRKANLIASQAETICTALDGIKQRADRISNLLAKLNTLFRKSIQHTEKIIDEKGEDKNNYTIADKESIMTCINLAAAIKNILDTKLLDEEGNITLQSQEAIQTGEDYLDKMNRAILLK